MNVRRFVTYGTRGFFGGGKRCEGRLFISTSEGKKILRNGTKKLIGISKDISY